MHREYRILNIVLSIGSNNKPVVLSDIAIFHVDKSKNINDFMGIMKQEMPSFPYIQEIMIHKNTDVVVLDDMAYNGDIKMLIKKNKHLILSDVDYKYKDYVYVICKVESDLYLVYTYRNGLEIVTLSDLLIFDDIGKLFNVKLVESKARGKTVYKVISGTNALDTKKRLNSIESRNYNSAEVLKGKKASFALDIVNLKANPVVDELVVNDGKVDKLSIVSYEKKDFILPSSIKEFLSVGRPYVIRGDFNNIDISNVDIINKNALLLKCNCERFIINEDTVRSSNLDYLVYSLREYTGDVNYRIGVLEVTGITSNEIIEILIRLLAELKYNTDIGEADIDSFPIQKIVVKGEYIDEIQKSGVMSYNKMINDSITSFSNVLLDNYTRAVGYYTRALEKTNKSLTELSLQSLSLLFDYEEELLEEIKFFNMISYLFSLSDNYDTTVYDNIASLINSNQEKRQSGTDREKDDLISKVLSDL